MEKLKINEKSPARLGRGLSALIPPTAAAPDSAALPEQRSPAEGVQEIAISAIVPNTLQPRSEFTEGALEELTASVKTHGILQPVMVRPRGGGRFELVAGERRFRAAERAGLTHIPAVVRSLTDEESLTVALIENIQREDLNPIEAARGYKQLMDQFGLTQTQLGQQIGKKQSTISNLMGLLRLPREIQDSIADGRLSVEHGKVLLTVDNPLERTMVWRDFLDLKMSRNDAREHAKAAQVLTSRPAAAKDADWIELEENLKRAFGMKAEVKPSGRGGGTLTLRFSSHDDLSALLERLESA